MFNNSFRVLIIDDNPNIHLDFVKILAINEFENKIKELRTQLFSVEPEQTIDDGELTIQMPFFMIETATQGVEGVEKVTLAAKGGKPFSLAFIDIRMPPGIDGIETIKKIWKIDKDIQIVICTAFSDYSWEETVRNLGIDDNLLILKKPFDSAAVCQMACALTRKWDLARIDREYIAMLEDKSRKSELTINPHDDIALDGIIVVSNEGLIYDYNVEFAEIWNIPYASLQSMPFASALQLMTKNMEPDNKLLADARRVGFDKSKVITANVALNDNRIIEYYTQPHKIDNKSAGRLWCFRDVTYQAIHQMQLEHSATHDQLTDLPNRVLLDDFVKLAISIANRNKTIFAVIFVDIDQFKLINDNLSHAFGDEVLLQFANRILAETRSSDLFARYGGDEFVLVTQNVTDIKFVNEIVDRLLKLIATPFRIANHVINVSASVGFSVYPTDAKTPEALLHQADLNMYNSKIEKQAKKND